MQSGGSRQRHVRHRVAIARRRSSATAAPIVTVLVVVCAGLAGGGQAQAASPGASPSPIPTLLPCQTPIAQARITITPSVVGRAQLPATFTTDDRYSAGSGGYKDVYTLDCAAANVTPVSVGDFTDASFTGDSTLSCGQHVFDDTYFAGGPPPDQEFYGTFTVSCITANPGTINSTQEPAQITVAGGPFLTFVQDAAHKNTFTIDIDGTRVAGTPGPPPVVGVQGTINTVIAAQGLSCSTHTITVNEDMGVGATITDTAPLTVQCTQPPPGNPTMTANPTVVVDGDLTHVTGTGFTPGAPVTVTWQTTSGTVLYGCSANALTGKPLNADASGKIDTYCLALPHGEMGAEQIAGDQPAAGQTPAEHATAAVVVEGGSMQPSTGDQFVFRR
jgi:hypothetical protein